MEVRDIEPLYYARDLGTGVALARIEDRPPRGALVDFMRGHGLIKPGAIVPVHWMQLWDYRNSTEDVPALFRWPQFAEWIGGWPDDLDEFKVTWKRNFGMPGEDLADGVIIVWEER